MDAVHAALSSADRAAGRSRGSVERFFANSFVFGKLTPHGATVGFGRLLTDRIVCAPVADIPVALAGEGTARSEHPELATAAT